MTFGPGKYDDLCTMVSEKVGIVDRGGGVLLIIIGGNRGNGFACQSDLTTLLTLPDILEATAKQIREDANRTS
jgi:hypothetical protein